MVTFNEIIKSAFTNSVQNVQNNGNIRNIGKVHIFCSGNGVEFNELINSTFRNFV